MVGSWVDYWNRSESTKQYQIGYSNNYHGLTYGLSAINRKVSAAQMMRRMILNI